MHDQAIDRARDIGVDAPASGADTSTSLEQIMAERIERFRRATSEEIVKALAESRPETAAAFFLEKFQAAGTTALPEDAITPDYKQKFPKGKMDSSRRNVNGTKDYITSLSRNNISIDKVGTTLEGTDSKLTNWILYSTKVKALTHLDPQVEARHIRLAQVIDFADELTQEIMEDPQALVLLKALHNQYACLEVSEDITDLINALNNQVLARYGIKIHLRNGLIALGPYSHREDTILINSAPAPFTSPNTKKPEIEPPRQRIALPLKKERPPVIKTPPANTTKEPDISTEDVSTEGKLKNRLNLDTVEEIHEAMAKKISELRNTDGSMSIESARELILFVNSIASKNDEVLGLKVYKYLGTIARAIVKASEVHSAIPAKIVDSWLVSA